MANHLKISYDGPSDTLLLDFAEPYEEQDSQSIATGVLARLNPATGAIETLEVLDFVARFGADNLLDLPIEGSLVHNSADEAPEPQGAAQK